MLMVFEKRLKHEDFGHMEDAEYREVLRRDLAKRRVAYARGRNRSGEVMISILLLMAASLVLMHHFGIIQLPVK
jgi:hypothetical protein